MARDDATGATDAEGAAIVQLRGRLQPGSGPSRRQPNWEGDPKLLFLVTTASGVAGALAPGHPTGIIVLDIALKVLLGVSVALAGALAAWPFLVVGSLVVTVATIRAPTIVPSVAALGASLAGVASRFTPPQDDSRRLGGGKQGEFSILRASVGAVICQVALRLTWPHVALVPSLVALVAVVVVITPGLAAAPRPVRRWTTRAMAVVVLLILALCLVAAFSALSARSSLEQALRTSDLGLSAIESGQQQTADTDFTTAEQQFNAAQGDLGAARWAQVVPIVAQQVRAVGVATSIGIQVVRAARQTSARSDVEALRVTGGVFPLRALEKLGPLFDRDLRVLRTSLGSAGALHSPWIVSPLRDKFNEELSRLRTAEREASTGALAIKAVPQLLGADGLRRYLVLFENPAESRASGGVVGDYAEISADKGRLHLMRVGSDGTLNTTGNPVSKRLVGPVGYIDRYSEFEPEDYWQNVPMSPDFPSVGEIAANLYPESGGTYVNGVISVDPVAMAGFLRAAGPISTAAWPGPITSSNVVDILAHDEFIHFASNGVARVAFVQTLIRSLWHDLVSRPLPPIPTMATDLAPALRGGHLLLYSRAPTVEHFFDTVHVAGATPTVHGDFLGVVTQNFAGNKLDWYLRRSITYTATLDRADDQINAVVTVKLRNLSPSSGLPPDILDPSPGADTRPGENELYVSIYSPWEADGASLDGKPLVVTDQQELGRLVYSALVKVPAGSQATIKLHLIGMWPHPAVKYRLTQYHQPVLFPDQVVTSVKVIG